MHLSGFCAVVDTFDSSTVSASTTEYCQGDARQTGCIQNPSYHFVLSLSDIATGNYLDTSVLEVIGKFVIY